MPFRSESQRRLFRAKLERGEITRRQYREFEEGTPKKLPSRVRKSRRRRSSSSRTRRA